jgi:hypothetical protein
MRAPASPTTRSIKDILTAFFAKLDILNVNPDHHVSITEAYQQVRDEMHESFKGFEHEFHFIGMYDFHETMSLFVKDHHIEMIITMPKDHSRFEYLLGNTNTKRLAYQSSIPVLAITSVNS